MSPEHKRRQTRAGAYEKRHFLDGVYQKKEPSDHFEPESEVVYPPEMPHIVQEAIATARVIFGGGKRSVRHHPELGRRLVRRNAVVGITDQGDLDRMVFRRVTSGTASWLSLVPKTGSKGVLAERHEKGYRRQARNAAKRKRKIGLW